MLCSVVSLFSSISKIFKSLSKRSCGLSLKYTFNLSKKKHLLLTTLPMPSTGKKIEKTEKFHVIL